MANTMKENLSPTQPERGLVQDDRSTPPLGVRHWQQSALNYSPPFTMLSPNSIPSLARQRDHSSCGRTDSPLQVRKQRSHAQQLNHTSIYADVPPPCMHAAMATAPGSYLEPPNTAHFTDVGQGGTVSQVDISGITLAENSTTSSSFTPPPAQEQGKFLRHKSVSRRMLSKVRDVKDGIAQISKSSHMSIRATDSEPSLVRRISGKRKQGLNEQQGFRSFGIRRDSIIGPSDSREGDVDMSGTQCSFTDSSVATDGLMSATLATPPSTTTDVERYAAHQQPMPLNLRSPSPNPTPRQPSGYSGDLVASEEYASAFSATVPHIELSVSTDRDSVDVGLARDIWVAVDTTVRTKLVNTGATTIATLRRRSLDVHLVLCLNTLSSLDSASIVHRCIVELCSRLDVSGDRISVQAVRERRADAGQIIHEAAQLLGLQCPQVTLVLERLGIAPSTTSDYHAGVASGHAWQPLPAAWDILLKQGLRKERAHTFVIAEEPDILIQILADVSSFPVHSIKTGISLQSEPTICATQAIWRLEFPTKSEVKPELLANMMRDLRHGCSMGAVPSLRICYKPMDRCRIVEVLGQKAVKDVKLGQRCSLFLKVHVPKVDTPRSGPDEEMDADSLFTELESIVGTLQTEFLHIEARYRHSVLPTHNNVVAIREVCHIKRPKTDTRWSGFRDTMGEADEDSLAHLHRRLTIYLKANYPHPKATKLIEQWALEHNRSGGDDRQHNEASNTNNPAVVITDTDSVSTKLPSSTSSCTIVPPRTLSAPKTTTAITIALTGPQSEPETSTEDSAHQLWRHIRRSSLTPAQLLDVSPERVQQLEASDETLKALRTKALANKRSVGAETLRAWRWNERVTGGEMPWLV